MRGITAGETSTRRLSDLLLWAALVTASWFVLGATAAPSATAQGDWVASCRYDADVATPPAPPSYARQGQAFELTATVDPPTAVGLSFRWELENIGELTGQTVQPIYAQTSDGKAQRVTLFVSDATRTERMTCQGIVTVAANDVVVPAGDGLVQNALTNAGPNATVFLDRGTHTGNQKLVPLDGQSLRGFLGTSDPEDPNDVNWLSKLDGSTLPAPTGPRSAITNDFRGPVQPKGVTINQLEITGYTTFPVAVSSGYHGVIHVQTAASGTTIKPDGEVVDASTECSSLNRITGYGPAADWEISEVLIHSNSGAGVILATNTVLRDSRIIENQHIGIGGSFTQNVLIDNVIVDGNSRSTDVNITNHSGGLKMTRSKELRILNSQFTKNRGPGVWLDIDVHSSQVRNNLLQGNLAGQSNGLGYGIFHEVSWASLITDNTITDNESGGILLAATAGYQTNDGVVYNEVRNNLVSNNPSAPAGQLPVTERTADRACTWFSERATDPAGTRIPLARTFDPAQSAYVHEFNLIENNDPNQAGASTEPVTDEPYFDSWVATCGAFPAYARVGEPITLQAAVEPVSAAQGLAFAWEVENVDDGDLAGQQVQVAYAQSSNGRAQTITLVVSDAARTERIPCRGIVAIQANDVVVDVGESLQAKLDQAAIDFPAGATIYLNRGTHTNNIDVTPHNGQTIRGFVNFDRSVLLSKLDGAGLTVDNERHHAITSNPSPDFADKQSTDVTIRDLEFTNYTTFTDPERSGFYGVIHVQTALSGSNDQANCTSSGRITGYGPAADWEISNVWVHDNAGAGVLLATNTVLRDSKITNNQHIGIGGSIAENVLVDNVTVDNNSLNPAVLVGWHSGGLKMTRMKDLRILNSRFTNNRGPGIWLDLDVHATQVRNNVLTGNKRAPGNAGNYGYGIFHEVSFASLIADNTITDNQTGGILLANSAGHVRPDGVTVFNVIENNLVDRNPQALVEVNNDRSCTWDRERAADPGKTRLPDGANPSGYFLAHNLLQNNVATAAGASSQPVADVPYVERTDGEPVQLPGDVNCDGQLEIADALLIAFYIAGDRSDGGDCPVDQVIAINAAAGDIDDDGTTDIDDAYDVLRCVVLDSPLCDP